MFRSDTQRVVKIMQKKKKKLWTFHLTVMCFYLTSRAYKIFRSKNMNSITIAGTVTQSKNKFEAIQLHRLSSLNILERQIDKQLFKVWGLYGVPLASF